MLKKQFIKIRQVRELKGFSQEYMAQQLSISQRAYSKLERHETKLDWNRIAQIASILGMKPIDLVNFDESELFDKGNTTPSHPYHNTEHTAKLIEQYEQRIKDLQNEIQFLRTQLSK